ncbi:beta-1,3-galactosyltransferase 1-like [Ruditapes philippinarum]|uniref:beta-1,3-galactosyltransferase 1-like n=1 Tax=Ruditapes philippinarum TaxID=129788 RepID=UPI00295BDDC0|nr:beta-1,3-galactosyltransferase 1-like [Ruditapes philippinarum]
MKDSYRRILRPKNVINYLTLFCIIFGVYFLYHVISVSRYVKNGVITYFGATRSDYRINSESIEDIERRLKYPVVMLPNLTSLINATNPKYPLTIHAPYLIENPHLCSSVSNLSVLVVVNTATDHFERRLAIRETWTNDKYYNHLGIVRVVFLIGKPKNEIIQNIINKEANQFKDILQGDFVDTYFNLTHKGVMGYKWITERCRNAKHIVKVDDDILVNMFSYFQKIHQNKSVKNAHVFCDYRTTPVFRDKRIKWFVSENQFRGVKVYKNFCRGKFVSIKNDVVPSLYISASKTPFFKLDDVLLYGYVMHNVPGLRYQTLYKENMKDVNKDGINCLEKEQDKCQAIIIQSGGQTQLIDTWSTIIKYFQK